MPLISGAVPPEHVIAVTASLRAEITGRQAGHLDAGLQGTYFLTKLLYELERTGGRYGLATMCIGGGQGIAVIVENLRR